VLPFYNIISLCFNLTHPSASRTGPRFKLLACSIACLGKIVFILFAVILMLLWQLYCFMGLRAVNDDDDDCIVPNFVTLTLFSPRCPAVRYADNQMDL